MPTTEIHDRVALLGAPLVSLAFHQVLHDWRSLLIGTSFLYANFFLSPDLDKAPNSAVARRWGPVRHYWTLYGRAFPHRSKLSHSIHGTVLRILYSFPIVLFPLLLFQIPLEPILVGWVLADLLHYFLDRNFQ